MKAWARVAVLIIIFPAVLALLCLTGCSRPDEPTSVDISGVTSEKPAEAPVPQGPPVEGTDWSCTGYSDGEGALVPVIDETTVTIRFDAGAFRGDTGVNTYSGRYVLGDETLVIDPALQLTERGGSPEEMDQESAYLAAIGQSKDYTLEDGVLTLIGEAGLRLATFEVAGGQ